MFETENPGALNTGAKNSLHTKFNGSKQSAQDVIEQFREFARQKGFELPAEIIANGEVQRFGPNNTCAYVFHPDGVPNGWVQNWRQGETRHQWKANGLKFNHEDRERANAEIRAAKAARDADKAERHANAAVEARRILDHETAPAPSDHPYLVKKGIGAHGLRIYMGDDPRWRDCLVIQVMRGDEPIGLQFIKPDGNKRFLPGTQKKGTYFLLGVPDGKLCICEGAATGVTIHEDTGYAVAVAFDAHNLIHVAKAFEGFPGEVIICADNDASRVNGLTGLPENIGLIKAMEAARETGAKLAVPSIDGDFNDLHRHWALDGGGWHVQSDIDRADYVQTPRERSQADELRDDLEEALSDPEFRASFTFDGDPIPPSGPQIIKGLIPRNGYGLFAGQSTVGKTFVAVNLAVAVASGGEFLGKPVKTRCGVFFLALEGGGNFQRRIDAAKQAIGLGEKLPIAFRTASGNLSNPDCRSALIHGLGLLDAYFRKAFGVPLGLIIIDTLSQAFALEDENSNAEASSICKALKEIADVTGAFTFAVHHFGKNLEQGVRGASAYRANVDVVLAAVSDRDRDTGQHLNRRLIVDKNRDGLDGLLSHFRLETVQLGEDEDGDPITSCVIEPVETQPKAAKKDKPLSPAEKAFEEAFNECANAAPIKHKVDGDGPEVIAVDAEKLKAEFFKRHPSGKEAARKTWDRQNGAPATLYKSGRYAFRNLDTHTLIWRCKPPGDDGGPDWDEFVRKRASKAASQSEARP